MTFLTILGVRELLWSFKLVLEGKLGKEIPESSRLEFREKFSANNFALSDAEYSTSGTWNRRGIADLPLLRTLLAIRPQSQISGTECTLLFYWHMQVWQLQEPFWNDY